MALQIEPFIFDCPSQNPMQFPTLKMTAKRYRATGMFTLEDGLTLLLFHGIGTHKEQWEPTIAHIFRKAMSGSRCQLREVWAFDKPSHGEAAVLNKQLLEQRSGIVSVYDWVPGIVLFARSEHVRGHRLVLCGHSAGSATAVLTALEYTNIISASIAGVILIEPAFLSRELFNFDYQNRMAQLLSSTFSTHLRRDQWNSKSDALQYFQKRIFWRDWDPSVLKLYTEHGLYQLEDGMVTLKCVKKREAESYFDVNPQADATLGMGELCHLMPMHLIWGAQSTFIPDCVRERTEGILKGHRTASVTRIKEAGHMVVQERPLGLAQAIHDFLSTVTFVSDERSRL